MSNCCCPHFVKYFIIICQALCVIYKLCAVLRFKGFKASCLRFIKKRTYNKNSQGEDKQKCDFERFHSESEAWRWRWRGWLTWLHRLANSTRPRKNRTSADACMLLCWLGEKKLDFPDIFPFRNTIGCNFPMTHSNFVKWICSGQNLTAARLATTYDCNWAIVRCNGQKWSGGVQWENKSSMPLSRSNNRLTSFEFIDSEAWFLFLAFSAWHRQWRQQPRTPRVQHSRAGALCCSAYAPT